jgi:MFS superfamily sulfate permease-like transporter
MKIKSFEFNLREVAGSMGDFGTLFPLAIGYIAVCGLNPAGLLVMMGLANIATGLIYRLPMPIEPMKVLAVVAIAQHWSPSLVYAAGFAMGLIWLLFAVTGIIDRIVSITPHSVIRGIQVALGVLLAFQALKMVSTWWVMGIIAVLVVLVLRQNRYAPAAVVLMVLGAGIMLVKGEFGGVNSPGFTLPPITGFTIGDLWQGLVRAGFAQIPLTATNAVIATAALIADYWPKKPVAERRLALNMGIMNVIMPFFGGMPLCHGAGGLAAQYYFGARTGGANIMEGLMEIAMGLFLATSIAGLFTVFPMAIIGAMLLMVGIELILFAKDVRLDVDVVPLAATVVVSLVSNMAFGFLAGLAAHYLLRVWRPLRGGKGTPQR